MFSRLCLACGIPGVVGVPVDAFVPAVLAVASISADPGVPVLAGEFLKL
jgi:hypothetical protein